MDIDRAGSNNLLSNTKEGKKKRPLFDFIASFKSILYTFIKTKVISLSVEFYNFQHIVGLP